MKNNLNDVVCFSPNVRLWAMSWTEKQKMFSKAKEIYKNHLHSSEWNSMGWEQRRQCVWMLNYLPSLIQKIFAEHLWCVGHQARYKWAKNAHTVSLALTWAICPHTHSWQALCSFLPATFWYVPSSTWKTFSFSIFIPLTSQEIILLSLNTQRKSYIF